MNLKTGPRKHVSQIERVPRIYKEAATVLQLFHERKGSVKSLATERAEKKHVIFKRLYALTCETIKNEHLIDKVIERAALFEKEPFLNQYHQPLTKVLVQELLFYSKSPQSQSKPVLAVLKHEAEIRKAFKTLESKEDDVDYEERVKGQVPMYARVNTLLSTSSEVKQSLIEEGLTHMEYDKAQGFDKFVTLLKDLQPDQFIKDFHFKKLLVFHPKQDFSKLSVYQERKVLVHDKASCLPVKSLNPPGESIVLDCCAAPGLKTVHLAAVMKNTGIIYAFDKDKTRFETLTALLKEAGATNCRTTCTDFLKVDPQIPNYAEIEYILLDVPCSGSGMIRRLENRSRDSLNEETRLSKLRGLQALILKRALQYPSVKKIVYSTCSVNEEENELVVSDVLFQVTKHNFEIANALPKWQWRGLDKYEFGHLCLRAHPSLSYTAGFFVAVFQKKL